MNTTSYRHSLTQILSRHLMHAAMPGLMPAAPAAPRAQSPGKLPAALVERLLQQEEQRRLRGHGASITAPIATFSAPQPAAHRAATYSYPIHIERADIDALPASAGVYVFRGANGIPLYVGRSVNLRSRVLAHLHNHEEELLVRQTRRIEFRRTVGELGAALLENSLVRDLQPLHNKKPRQKRCLFTLRLSPAGQPQVAQVAERDFSRAENLFGIFASERAAQEALQKLVEQHELCSIAAGLEESAGEGMACFARQIRRCRGCCTGEESHESHRERLMLALEDLRILPWPYEGAMGVIEERDGWSQVHVIDHWRYLGTLDEQHQQLQARPAASLKGFDLDSYKLVIKPFLLQQLELRALPGLTLPDRA
ncbi:nucleotide excision repair endonuclease [Herbaspirillum sp. WKF16]|uniref:nucleotide excision repair endonuclease n=1 Tax=Herbaspirillum sp. WKF16 TaxID=3028312 RepID=UPI0023A971D1|nr:nucleotide excision repair endonuclease [Herbaspirillum sp. WKF16]WDZ98295.1 nucleotide excision repair endonuclease [Herbaspirillum sp. WKF16]